MFVLVEHLVLPFLRCRRIFRHRFGDAFQFQRLVFDDLRFIRRATMRDTDLGDARPAHLLDCDLIIGEKDLLADPRQATEEDQGHAADGIHQRILDVEIGKGAQISQAHVTGDGKAVAALFPVVLLPTHRARDFAEDEAEHVLHGDDAEHLAILADDNGGAGIETLEVLEHLIDFLRWRDEVRRFEDFLELYLGAVGIGIDPAQ